MTKQFIVSEEELHELNCTMTDADVGKWINKIKTKSPIQPDKVIDREGVENILIDYFLGERIWLNPKSMILSVWVKVHAEEIADAICGKESKDD